jgi:hypothetical protein
LLASSTKSVMRTSELIPLLLRRRSSLSLFHFRSHS